MANGGVPSRRDYQRDYPFPQYPGGLITRPPYQVPGSIPGATGPTNNLTNQYNLYNTGVNQNAEDYSDIMNRYRELYKQDGSSSQPMKFQQANYTPMSVPSQLSTLPINNYVPKELNYSPLLTPEKMSYTPGAAPTNVAVTGRSYTPDAEMIGAMNRFKDMGQTGGYSDADINALRARGVSPIRSVYANAQRNIDRNRSLRGGMGSNYNAVTAKTAREMADTIGEQTNRVNAGIAEQVAAGKLAGNQGYANLSSTMDAAKNAAESETMAAKNRIGEFNADAMNRYSEANAGRQFDTGRVNTEAANRANEANVFGRSDVNRYNAEAANKANLENIANRMATERYNTEGVNRANEMNWSNANDVNRFNAQGANDTARFNQGLSQQRFGNQQNILDAMRSLYGTTPALANLFGNQAMQGAEFQNQVNQQNQQLPPWMTQFFH